MTMPTPTPALQDDPRPAADRLGWLVVGVLAVGTDAFVLAGLLPAIAAEFGIGLAEAGRLAVAYGLSYAVGAPLAAVATAGLDRRRVLLGALLVFVFASLVAAGAGSLALLLPARMALALAGAAYFPAASAYAVAASPPAARGRALTRVYGGMTLALVLGIPASTWIAARLGWRAAFCITAALGLLAIAGIALRLPARPAVGATPGLAERLRLAADPAVLPVLAVTLAGVGGSFVVHTYLAAVLGAIGPTGPALLGGLLLVFGLAGMAGNRLAGHAIDRGRGGIATAASLGLKALAFAALALLALPSAPVALATAAAVPSAVGPGAMAPLLVAVLALYGLAGWMFPPLQQARLAALAPHSLATALSLNASALYLGMAAGALIGGQALAHWGAGRLGWVGAGGELLALALLRWSGRHRAAPTAGHPSGSLP